MPWGLAKQRAWNSWGSSHTGKIMLLVFNYIYSVLCTMYSYIPCSSFHFTIVLAKSLFHERWWFKKSNPQIFCSPKLYIWRKICRAVAQVQKWAFMK
jgi:hypothetical protein